LGCAGIDARTRWHQRAPRATPCGDRARILEAAEDLLARSGSDGVSLRAVAERIQYSASAIYSYFSTKDDLLAAVAAHGFRQLNSALTAVSETTDSSPLARLRELYWRYYESARPIRPTTS